MDTVKIKTIRNKIDKLDYKLLNLIKKRTNLVNQVIKVKLLKKQIVDNKRIIKILSNIKKRSLLKKIDPQITRAIWIAMIRSFIKYERKNFKKK